MKNTALKRRRRTLFVFLGAFGLTLVLVGRLDPPNAAAESLWRAAGNASQREPTGRRAGAPQINASLPALRKVYVANLGRLAEHPRHRAAVEQALQRIQEANRTSVASPLPVAMARPTSTSSRSALAHQASVLQGWTGCDSFAVGCNEQGGSRTTTNIERQPSSGTWLLSSTRHVADQLAAVVRTVALAALRGFEETLLAPPVWAADAPAAATARRQMTEFDGGEGIPRLEL